MTDTMRPGGTYRTLEEQKEHLSPAEERFERGRRTVGLFLGPLVGIVMYLAPLKLNHNQHMLAAILSFVIVFWLTEAIPIPATALLALALCILFAVPVLKPGSSESAADIVFGSFASSTIFLFIGGFIIAEAMMRHGLDRRFAFRVLSLPGVGKSTYGVIIAFGAIAALISAFISNTAAAAMLFPIGIGIIGALAKLVSDQAGGHTDPRRLKFGTALMLMIAYGASVGGLITPIGSPPNLIGRKFIEDQTRTKITFVEWTLMALPIVVTMFVALCIILLMLNKPEVRRLHGADEFIAEERRKLGKLSVGERNTLIAFAFAVFFWVMPGVVGLVAGETSPAYAEIAKRLDEGVVALLAAGLLFLLPTNWKERRFTMNWNDATKIDWGTIILFGSGIVLGKLLSQTGLAKIIGTSISTSLGVTSLFAITALGVVVAILISETTSNTASVGIVVPIILPIAVAAGVNPIIPGLAAVFGASYGFMLPVSTPPNAIVYGSGMVPITSMVRSGIVFDIIGALLIVGGVTLFAGVVGIV